MTDPPDYLWDRTGSDPEVERLEELFGGLRVPAVPPELPSKRRLGGWIAAAAVVAALVSLEVATDRRPVPVEPGAGGSEQDGAASGPTAPRLPFPAGRSGPPGARPASADGADAAGSEAGAVLLLDDEQEVQFVAGEVRFEDDDRATGLAYSEEGTIYAAQGRLRHPRLSADGSRVSFELVQSAPRSSELWIGDLVGSRVVGLTRKEEWGGGGPAKRSGALAWSAVRPRDHAWIVANEGELYEIHLSSGEVIRSPGGANLDPSWDPTASRLVFSSSRSGSVDLYLWDDGTELQLTYESETMEVHPRFLPDGNRVVYAESNSDGADLVMLDIERGARRKLVEWEGVHCTRASPSPDGDKIAFAANRETDGTTDFDLWVTGLGPDSIPVRLGGPVHLPSRGSFSWTPDGQYVVAAMADPGTSDCIALVPIDGSEPECLDLGTEVNRDPHVVAVDDALLLAWVSLRRSGRQLNIVRLQMP